MVRMEDVQKSAQGWIKHLDFIILDLICLHIAFIIAYMMRHGMNNPYAVPIYRNVAFVITAIDILVIVFFESLKNVLKRGYYKEFSMTFKHVCLVILLTIFYLFFYTGKRPVFAKCPHRSRCHLCGAELCDTYFVEAVS